SSGGYSRATARATHSGWTGAARHTRTVRGCARLPTPTPPSTPARSRRSRERQLAALGGVRPRQAWPGARALGIAARTGRGDGAAQRARRLHAPAGGGVDLGHPVRGHHREQPGRAGQLLRPGGRQGLPARLLLRHPRGRGVPVTSDASPGVGGLARDAASGPTAYLLGLADDALVYAQRLGEWMTRAPQIEEDVALGNIGLDLLGQARALLTRVGELEGAGRDEDDLAYLRDEREFRNVHLVERPRGDF